MSGRPHAFDGASFFAHAVAGLCPAFTLHRYLDSRDTFMFRICLADCPQCGARAHAVLICDT